MGFGGGTSSSSIGSASDAALNNPANKDFLGYDSSSGKWRNQTTSNFATLSSGRLSESQVPTRLSETEISRRPVARIWTGSSYPARINGVTNIFFGPTDPGLLMNSDDYWAVSGTTTMPEVVSQALDTSSGLYSAIRSAAANTRMIPLNLQVRTASGIEFVTAGSDPKFAGYSFPSGATSSVYASTTIPLDWENARVRVRYMRSASGSGNIRLSFKTQPYTDGVTPSITQYTTTNSLPSPFQTVTRQSPAVAVTPGGGISVEITRIGTSTDYDTFGDSIIILEAWLERS